MHCKPHFGFILWVLLATSLAPFLSIFKGLKTISRNHQTCQFLLLSRLPLCYRILSSWGESCILCTVIKARMKHQSESVSFSSLQLLSRVWLFTNPWTRAGQASLSITNSQSLPKLMSIESLMTSNHLILCRPLLLLPSVFPSMCLFKWVSSSHQVARILEFQFQHHSFQWTSRTDLLQDGLVGSPCSPRDSQESSPKP